MATMTQGLSSYDHTKIPNAKGMRIGIIVSGWNSEVTYAMRDGAIASLTKHGVDNSDISVSYVPGSFELTLGARWMADSGNYDAIICLGCVIQGETRHFDFICQSVTQGITQLNLTYGIPVIFGVLTTHNQEQALARAGGKYGNKGDEAAFTAIQMVALKKSVLNAE